MQDIYTCSMCHLICIFFRSVLGGDIGLLVTCFKGQCHGRKYIFGGAGRVFMSHLSQRSRSW